jgi:hypothetical protein
MATTWLEMTVGVLLVLFSVAVVIIFIFLCEYKYIMCMRCKGVAG